MFSVDRYLTRAVRAARRLFARTWHRGCEHFGEPAEHSPLSSLHFLLTEYEEPSPLVAPTPWKMKRGPFTFLKQDVKLTNRAGKGTFQVKLLVPEATDGPLATVVVSPGLGAHPNASRYLEEHLASYGYQVVRPTHRGSDWLSVLLKTPLGAFTTGEFRRRVGEVETVLSELGEGGIGRTTKTGKVCLMGHSFGALTNFVVSGLPCAHASGSERHQIDLLVALSPYGNSFPTQRLGIDLRGLEQFTLPTLFISGTKDELFTLGRGCKTHLEPFTLCGSTQKKHLLVGDTRHGNFSEMFGWVKPHTRTMVNTTVTSFLDAHLTDCPKSQYYLERQLPIVAYEYHSWVF